MSVGETGDKHLPKTCWPTEWRVGMWGISICQSTAWRGCMKWTRENLWGAYDGVGTCTHWGAVGGFSIPVAQSDPCSFDYTGAWVEKNLGTIGITQNTNRVAKLLRFFENCQGKFTVISLGILVLDYSSCSPISTLLTFYTTPPPPPLWIFLSCHYLCSRCSNDFVLLLQIIWCNQESKKKQSLEKLCILRLRPSKLSTTNCQKTLIKQRTKDKLLFLLESTRNLEEIILQS